MRARFLLPGGERTVEVEVREGRRSARVDGKPVRDPDELFGGIAVVAFTPDDLLLVKGGPEGRRRLMDRAVQNRHPPHLADARDYLRALKSRNQLLRDQAPDALRAPFDQLVARLGARIRLRREQVLAELVPLVRRAFAEVARGEEPLALAYLAAGRDQERLGEEAQGLAEPALAERLLAALAARLPRDLERGYTSLGPHADDLQLALGGKPARLYASQGQGRAVVLALRIGEIENLRRALGRAPLLLLDDVSSELDPERNRYLLDYLSRLDGQVLLTTTDPGLVAPAVRRGAAAGEDAPRFFQVRAGGIAPDEAYA